MLGKMNKPGKKGLKRIVEATRYSVNGLKAAYKQEEAIRQESWLGILMIIVAIYIAKNGIELALLIGSVLLVFLMELINSAIESVVDRIGFDYHPLSGQAKDIGSALVMVAILMLLVTWNAIIFF